MIGAVDAYEPCEAGCGMYITYDLRELLGTGDVAGFWERPYQSPPGSVHFITILHSPWRCQIRKQRRAEGET